MTEQNVLATALNKDTKRAIVSLKSGSIDIFTAVG